MHLKTIHPEELGKAGKYPPTETSNYVTVMER